MVQKYLKGNVWELWWILEKATHFISLSVLSFTCVQIIVSPLLNKDYFCTPTIHPRPNMKRVLIKARWRKKVAQSREKVRGARKKWRRPDPAMQCNASCVTLAPGFLFVSTIQHHHHRCKKPAFGLRGLEGFSGLNTVFRWVHLVFFSTSCLAISQITKYQFCTVACFGLEVEYF